MPFLYLAKLMPKEVVAMSEEYFVRQHRDQRIGDTWNATGLFGVNAGGALSFPGPCPICGAPAKTCIGDANDANPESSQQAHEEPPAAAA